jgi:2,2-dialkylglycine decarboxylase (pyruvate)
MNGPIAHTGNKAFWQLADRHILRYGSDFTDFVPCRAEGTVLYDAAGRQVLDFTSGQMSGILGHCHPEITATLREEAGRLTHIYSCMLSQPVVDLAVALARLIPELPRSVFLSTGSEANEAALRIAKMVTGKWEVVGFSTSWHGNTGSAAASSYKTARRGQGPLTPGNYAIPAPHSFHPRFPGVSWEQELDDSFALLDRQCTGNLAAFIAEPILSAGGVVDLPMGYLAALRKHCDARGMLLILDEAQTGLGRTGTMFAFERDGIVPDIITLSKTLGAGMPLAALMCSEKIAKKADEAGFFFMTTHVNDPLPAAIGLKVAEIVCRDNLAERARVIGARLTGGLRELQTRHPCIGDVRGRGLLLGLEFVSIGSMSAAKISERVIQTAIDLGLSANNSSPSDSGGIMRIAPPLTVKESEIDLALEILDAAITTVNVK